MRLRITIESGSIAGRFFDVRSGSISIGRNQNANIRFDPHLERVVSGNHATIEKRIDGFYLIDKSTNGTFVNNERISQTRLKDGDRLVFGRDGVAAIISIDNFSANLSSETILRDRKNAIKLPAHIVPTVNPQLPLPPGANRSVFGSVSSIGVGEVAIQHDERSVGKYIGVGIALICGVFLSLIVVGIMLLQLGPIASLVAAITAFAPVLLYVFPFVWLDRYDPEPFWLLSGSFAWGSLVAVVISIVLNTLFGTVVGAFAGPEMGDLFGAVISAPMVEEISKGAGIFLIAVFFRKYFDGILDGIVFAGLIALGFSTVENVLYYGQSYVGFGISGLFSTFVLRGILSPFVHATFTSMTGIGFGIARESHNRAVKVIFPMIGLLFAIMLHAIWNGLASILGGAFLVFYFLFEIPFFLIFVIFAAYTMWRQNRILKEMLAIDVACGLIPQEHFEKATSAFRGAGWLATSILKGKYFVTSRYLRAIGKLGLSYWHIQRANRASGETVSRQQNPVFRAEVEKCRVAVES